MHVPLFFFPKSSFPIRPIHSRVVAIPQFLSDLQKMSNAKSIYHLLDVDQTIAIGDSDNGIITTLFLGLQKPDPSSGGNNIT